MAGNCLSYDKTTSNNSELSTGSTPQSQWDLIFHFAFDPFAQVVSADPLHAPPTPTLGIVPLNAVSAPSKGGIVKYDIIRTEA